MTPLIDIASSPSAVKTYDRIDVTTDTTTTGTSILVRATASGNVHDLGTIRSASPTPHLASASIVTSRIEALDVLEHVVDEEAWIGLFAQLLAPGGSLTVRVPLEGPVAWLDALNIMRYVQDVTGLGRQPLETKMKGWHRHYRPVGLAAMLERVGLVPTATVHSGSPHHELPHLAALAWGTIVRHDRDTELRAGERRARVEAGARAPRLGPLSTRVTITATKPLATTPVS
jgi:hypothetical protein